MQKDIALLTGSQTRGHVAGRDQRHGTTVQVSYPQQRLVEGTDKIIQSTHFLKVFPDCFSLVQHGHCANVVPAKWRIEFDSRHFLLTIDRKVA